MFAFLEYIPYYSFYRNVDILDTETEMLWCLKFLSIPCTGSCFFFITFWQQKYNDVDKAAILVYDHALKNEIWMMIWSLINI